MHRARTKTAKVRRTTKPKGGFTKFQRYRRNKRRQGMKLLRIWVPDPKAPGFKEEARRQMRLLRGSPEEAEVMRFIEAAADWPKE
jgi:hypothetical protein